MNNNNTTLTDSILQSSINWNDTTENYIKNAPKAMDFVLSRENADAIRKNPSFISPAGSVSFNETAKALIVESASKATSLADLNGGFTR